MSWSGGDWMCGVCQHVNFKKREACQSCGYPKYGGPDPSTYRYNRTEALAGDWFCNCRAHNYASRSCCYRCGSIKYGSDTLPAGWKTGDWLCPRIGCGVIMRAGQNASNAECQRISTDRRKFRRPGISIISLNIFVLQTTFYLGFSMSSCR